MNSILEKRVLKIQENIKSFKRDRHKDNYKEHSIEILLNDEKKIIVVEKISFDNINIEFYLKGKKLNTENVKLNISCVINYIGPKIKPYTYNFNFILENIKDNEFPYNIDNDIQFDQVLLNNVLDITSIITKMNPFFNHEKYGKILHNDIDANWKYNSGFTLFTKFYFKQCDCDILCKQLIFELIYKDSFHLFQTCILFNNYEITQLFPIINKYLQNF